MKVVVKLFAGLRDRAGTGTIALEMDGEATVADAIAAAELAGPRHWRAPESLMVAVNNVYVDRSARLNDRDEMALIPPVSGGQCDVPGSLRSSRSRSRRTEPAWEVGRPEEAERDTVR